MLKLNKEFFKRLIVLLSISLIYIFAISISGLSQLFKLGQKLTELLIEQSPIRETDIPPKPPTNPTNVNANTQTEPESQEPSPSTSSDSPKRAKTSDDSKPTTSDSPSTSSNDPPARANTKRAARRFPLYSNWTKMACRAFGFRQSTPTENSTNTQENSHISQPSTSSENVEEARASVSPTMSSSENALSEEIQSIVERIRRRREELGVDEVRRAEARRTEERRAEDMIELRRSTERVNDQIWNTERRIREAQRRRRAREDLEDEGENEESQQSSRTMQRLRQILLIFRRIQQERLNQNGKFQNNNKSQNYTKKI